MPKPSEKILAWIGGLDPPDELAMRMALCLNNPWCREDSAWQHRIEELSATLIASPADRARYERRAAETARDMDTELRRMMAQFADPLQR